MRGTSRGVERRGVGRKRGHSQLLQRRQQLRFCPAEGVILGAADLDEGEARGAGLGEGPRSFVVVLGARAAGDGRLDVLGPHQVAREKVGRGPSPVIVSPITRVTRDGYPRAGSATPAPNGPVRTACGGPS